MPRAKSVSAKKTSAKKKAPTVAPVEAWNDEKLLELFENREELSKAISIVLQCQLFLDDWQEYRKLCKKLYKKRLPSDWEFDLLEKKHHMASILDLTSGDEEIRENWDRLFDIRSRELWKSLGITASLSCAYYDEQRRLRGEGDGA